MSRGVTRLDGAWRNKKVWRPRVRIWGLSEANVLFWKSTYDIVVAFWSPAVIQRPGNCAPLAPSLRLWCYAIKIGKLSEIKQIFKSERHELLFHEHLQFSNTIPHGFDTDCQRSLLAAFQVSSCSSVSLPILPHAFFRRGLVFVLLIIKLFRHSTSYFFNVG